MGTIEGTTGTGVVAEVSHAALAALDTKLIQEIGDLIDAANKSAAILGGNLVDLAAGMVKLHQTGSWKRAIDGKTGKIYTSAQAWYEALNKEKVLPCLHLLVRRELETVLFDGETLSGIGTNEFAKMVGCDKSTVSRELKRLEAANAANAPSDAQVTDEVLDGIAAEAEAEAITNGQSEIEAAHTAEVARSEAKAEAEAAEAEAEAEAAKAKAEAEAEAERKTAKRAAKSFATAAERASDNFHLMTVDDQVATVDCAIKLADTLSKALVQFVRNAEVAAKAEVDKVAETAKARTSKRRSSPKPGRRHAAKGTPAAATG